MITVNLWFLWHFYHFELECLYIYMSHINIDYNHIAHAGYIGCSMPQEDLPGHYLIVHNSAAIREGLPGAL